MNGANTSHMRGQGRRNHDTKGNQAMPSVNYYDVTTWPVGNAAEDIGEVINSIIAEIKARQTATDEHHGGKPGAVIYVPPGDYHLRTQVVIDVSFLRIEGSGHGFTSSSIRFNVPEDEWPDLHELWPGGSRIVVDLPIAGDDGRVQGRRLLHRAKREPPDQLGRVRELLHRRDALRRGRLGAPPGEHLRQRQDGHLRRQRQRLVPHHRHGVRVPRARADDLQRRRALRP